MAKPEWGIKRVCQSCSTLFYDFDKTPIVCPSCGAAFDPEAVLKSRRNRAPIAEEPKPVKAKDEDDPDLEEDDDEEDDDVLEDEDEDDAILPVIGEDDPEADVVEPAEDEDDDDPLLADDAELPTDDEEET